ncbi:MAG: hypothetical protein EZS28_026377 [Streblomastix strix]|uniref:Uncharacterized protein n=1 Tax=Streblomastix strix TaxID=222440 RepID=A0A5J4V7H5_9EUKA|nr:MAG: hypothetical protein EZS28_026377 [Streblomastix strix]
MKDLITIPTKIVPYAEVNEALDELIECKKAYDEVNEYKLEKQMKEESKKDILSHIGTKDFSIKYPHTIVLFDDAMSIFKNKNNPLNKKLFKNRQPRITYFLYKETLWNEYAQLGKREALLVQYSNDGTIVRVI